MSASSKRKGTQPQLCALFFILWGCSLAPGIFREPLPELFLEKVKDERDVLGLHFHTACRALYKFKKYLKRALAQKHGLFVASFLLLGFRCCHDILLSLKERRFLNLG